MQSDAFHRGVFAAATAILCFALAGCSQRLVKPGVFTFEDPEEPGVTQRVELREDGRMALIRTDSDGSESLDGMWDVCKNEDGERVLVLTPDDFPHDPLEVGIGDNGNTLLFEPSDGEGFIEAKRQQD